MGGDNRAESFGSAGLDLSLSRLARVLLPALLAASIVACGGGGGGGGGGAASGGGRGNAVTSSEVIASVHSDFSRFGIANFSVDVSQESFALEWNNPVTPDKAISSYSLDAIAYNSAINVSRTPDAEVYRNITYQGDGRLQQFNYTGLTQGNYYEFFAMANYADGNSTKTLRVFNGRLLAEENSDGRGLSDIQEKNILDADGDGVPTTRDNCPLVANPNQLNSYGGPAGDVCEDTDGDRFLDILDNCPITSNTDQNNSYGGLAGDACEDTDGDLVLDISDNCPLVPNTEPNGDQNNSYGGPAGDACEDTDNDSVLDILDNCPINPNTNQLNSYGGPAGDLCDDTDGDLILDISDNCPLVSNREPTGDQNNSYGGPAGDACEDTDYDGLLDINDNCPENYNPRQSNTYGDGPDGAGTDNMGDACDDTDGDGIFDARDIDNNNNQLIDIFTYEQLNAVRNNLAGTGLDLDNADNDLTTGGITTGCPPGGCQGYELLTNISLAGRGNWQPIGEIQERGAAFTGTFDGNGHRISDINMEYLEAHGRLDSSRFGFFAAVMGEGSETQTIKFATVRDLHLSNISITVSDRLEFVGGLVGFADIAVIDHVRVDARNIRMVPGMGGFTNGMFGDSNSIGDTIVGGLVGILNDRGHILLSLVTAQEIFSYGSAAGLVGTIRIDAGSSIPGEDETAAKISIRASGALITNITTDLNNAPAGVAKGDNEITAQASGILGTSVGVTEDEQLTSNLVVVHKLQGITRTAGISNIRNAKIRYSLALIPQLMIMPSSTSVPHGFGLISDRSLPNSFSYANNVTLDGAPLSLLDPDGVQLAPVDAERGRTLADLRNSDASIYNTWDDSAALRCRFDANDGNFKLGGNEPVWSLGDSTQYPALNCLLATLAEQRQMIDRILAGRSPIDF